MKSMQYAWDLAKSRANAKKHGVRFADAVTALEDDRAVTVEDLDSEGEQRFVSLGADAYGQLLVTVFAQRADTIRIISARKASKREQQHYEGD